MFKSKELVKIRVMGVKSSLKLFISELHSLKLMHLTDFKKDSEIPELDIGDSFGEAEEYSRMLIDLGSLIDNLNLNTDYKPLKSVDKTKVRKTVFELKDLLNKKHSLASEQKILLEEIRSPASLFTVSKSTYYVILNETRSDNDECSEGSLCLMHKSQSPSTKFSPFNNKVQNDKHNN